MYIHNIYMFLENIENILVIGAEKENFTTLITTALVII